jgi:hypothetical protein
MKINVYRNYRFVDKDPIIDAVRTVVKSEEHLKNSMVHEISGVATATLDNWFEGSTRRPHNATVCQVTAALGYVRRDELDRDGRVIVGFRKARTLDYKAEAEKQADWIIKQNSGPKKKRRRKKNGHANGHVNGNGHAHR